MTGKFLGKIDGVRFGFVPDCPFLFGLILDFKLGDGYGIGCSYTVNISDACKWSAEERKEGIEEIIDSIVKIMQDAKVNDVIQLKNIPVEVTVENNTFKNFRILTEVL